MSRKSTSGWFSSNKLTGKAGKGPNSTNRSKAISKPGPKKLNDAGYARGSKRPPKSK